jgi:Zn-dependent protease
VPNVDQLVAELGEVLLDGLADGRHLVRADGDAHDRTTPAAAAVPPTIGGVAGATAFALEASDGPLLVVAALGWLTGVNVVIVAFNLVPAAPLDGGRVLRAALSAWQKDPERAAVTSAKAAHALGVMLVVVRALLFMRGSGGLWYVLLGWFVINAATAEELHPFDEAAIRIDASPRHHESADLGTSRDRCRDLRQ